MIENLFVHPNYISNKKTRNNIAIIKLKEDLNATRFIPLALKGLRSNATYTLYDSIPMNVTVFSPQICGSDSPQAYCARYEMLAPNCFSNPSSSLVSETDEGKYSFHGFLIDEDSCTTEESDFDVYYHSIEDFAEWIQKVSSSNLASKVSLLTTMSALWISFNFIM
jgi:hypothetical protein